MGSSSRSEKRELAVADDNDAGDDDEPLGADLKLIFQQTISTAVSLVVVVVVVVVVAVANTCDRERACRASQAFRRFGSSLLLLLLIVLLYVVIQIVELVVE